MADHFPEWSESDLKCGNKLGDRITKQLLNSVIEKYRDFSLFPRSIICLSRMIYLLATENYDTVYFAQTHPIVHYFLSQVLKNNHRKVIKQLSTSFPRYHIVPR